ncbi:hypothetical protein OBBRIDRAFT_35229 [Obba rivulosa]|uniref:DUF6533 domain-containing protein n=1 Tax=Obba rivulosa TaxID=1052685 RepID=A0A8E2DJL4_9APHY|nr:hypothetical protein OBBRIDRAFT_35229 [Obba rivulosa]
MRSYNTEIEKLQGILVCRYCTLAALSILCFEFWATLPLEIEVFWKRGTINFGSVFYALNRYLFLVAAVPITFEFFGEMSESVSRACRPRYHIRSDCSAAMPSTANIPSVSHSFHADFCCRRPDTAHLCTIQWNHGCDFHPWETDLEHILKIPVEWVVITRSAARWLHVLRQFMAILNAVNILTILLISSPEQKGILMTLTNVISSILITRLALNLRASDCGGPGTTSTYGRAESTLKFHTISFSTF